MLKLRSVLIRIDVDLSVSGKLFLLSKTFRIRTGNSVDVGKFQGNFGGAAGKNRCKISRIAESEGTLQTSGRRKTTERAFSGWHRRLRARWRRIGQSAWRRRRDWFVRFKAWRQDSCGESAAARRVVFRGLFLPRKGVGS